MNSNLFTVNANLKLLHNKQQTARQRQQSQYAKLQSPADAADVSDDFPSDLDIDVQTPDGAVVQLELHKSEMSDDVPLLLMRDGEVKRYSLPPSQVIKQQSHGNNVLWRHKMLKVVGGRLWVYDIKVNSAGIDVGVPDTSIAYHYAL